MTLSEKFFRNVTHYRKQKNLTLRQAGALAGRNHSWWHQNAEGYKSNTPTLKTVELVAEALNMKPIGLLRDPPTFEINRPTTSSETSKSFSQETTTTGHDNSSPSKPENS